MACSTPSASKRRWQVVQLDEGISLKPTLKLQGLNLVSRLDRRVFVVMLAMVGFLSALSSLPGADVGLFQQLNQELGALCQAPPAKAVKVCEFPCTPGEPLNLGHG